MWNFFRVRRIFLTFWRHAGGQIVRQLEGVLDGHAMLGPVLVLARQHVVVAYAHDVVVPVERLGVVAEEADPELAHRLLVELVVGPELVEVANVAVEPAVPAVDAQRGLLLRQVGAIQRLQARQQRRRRVHQVVKHHNYVGVWGERAARGVADAAHLGEVLDHVAEYDGALVDLGIGAQQVGVLERERVVQADVALDGRLLVAELDDGHLGRHALLDHVELLLVAEECADRANDALEVERRFLV